MGLTGYIFFSFPFKYIAHYPTFQPERLGERSTVAKMWIFLIKKWFLFVSVIQRGRAGLVTKHVCNRFEWSACYQFFVEKTIIVMINSIENPSFHFKVLLLMNKASRNFKIYSLQRKIFGSEVISFGPLSNTLSASNLPTYLLFSLL